MYASRHDTSVAELGRHTEAPRILDAPLENGWAVGFAKEACGSSSSSPGITALMPSPLHLSVYSLPLMVTLLTWTQALCFIRCSILRLCIIAPAANPAPESPLGPLELWPEAQPPFPSQSLYALHPAS